MKYRKLLLKAYKAKLKYRLYQWKSKVEIYHDGKQKLEKAVVAKMKKRLLKQAFNAYYSKIKQIKDHEKIEGRLTDVEARFNLRKLKLFFNQMCVYTNTTVSARKQFKKVLVANYYRELKPVFVQWRKYKNYKDEKKLRVKKQMVLEEMQEQEAAVDDQGDVVFQQEHKKKELVRSQVSMSRKVMKKTISAWRNYNYYAAFGRWKQTTEFLRKQEKCL